MKKNRMGWDEIDYPVRKFLRTMKLSVFLFLLGIAQVLAGNSFAQNTKLSINLENTRIEKVLLEIENNSSYKFIYNKEDVDVESQVSIHLKDKSINETLDVLFEGENIRYDFYGNQIILRKAASENEQDKTPKKVSGNVTDNTGAPLPGVAVVIKGTTRGTITNFDGDYSLDQVPVNATLVFSFVGMNTVEIPVAGSTTFDVVMEEGAIGIEEVVAVGYGSQKRVNLTGSVSTVELNDLDGRAITNSNQALQGKVAGVSIVQNSGRPGDDNATIRIRGVSSIDNNNDPLVIIDGVEGDFNEVHPSDIKSISVLKDAASAAIYGSRASAGVIIIETKEGLRGLRVDYTGSTSIQKATRLPEVADSWTYAELRNEARANVGSGPFYSDDEVELFKYQINPNYGNTDWYDIYFDEALMQNHYISARGGEKNYKFSSSVGYTDQEGILWGTSSQKVSYRNRLDANFLEDKVRIGFAFSGYNQKIDELISSTNTVMAEIATMKPVTFIQSVDPDTGEGNLYSYFGRFIGADALGGGIDREYNYLNTQFSAEVEPVKNMKGKVVYARNVFKTDYVRFSPEFFTSSDIDEKTISKRESVLEKSWAQTDRSTLTASLDYSLDINRHSLSAFAAYERLERSYDYDAGLVKELSTNQTIFDFGDPTSHFLSSRANESATVSYFGRFNYDFADKYLLEMNIRRDGSSRFAEGNKWGIFPSVSAGWRISEEQFFKALNLMSLKFRASWGRLGNQNIGSYYAASNQMSGGEYYSFGNTIVPGRGTTILANPETTWETTEQINVGFDASFNNRLNLTFDYFYKNTYDILARVTIPPSLGVSSSPYQNIGDMLNKGAELSLEYNSKPRPNGFNYSINGNVSYLINEVTNLGVLEFVDHTSELRSQVGEPFASFYGYKTDGIYQIDDFTWQNESDPSIAHADRDYVLKEGMADPSGVMTKPAPGDLKLRDVKEDGFITPEDKTIIGHSIPKIQYGISANVSYKSFGLNVIGQGIAEADAYMTGNLVAPFWNAGGPILQSLADNRWTYENPSTEYIRLFEDKGRDAINSDYYLHDASYFRVKSVELSYSLPKNVINRWGIKKCRVFTSAENLLLITNFVEGFDPERDYRRTRANFHPQAVTYTLGLNLSF